MTLVILVIRSISQAFGHMNFDMNPLEENSMNLFNMKEVIREAFPPPKIFGKFLNGL